MAHRYPSLKTRELKIAGGGAGERQHIDVVQQRCGECGCYFRAPCTDHRCPHCGQGEDLTV